MTATLGKTKKSLTSHWLKSLPALSSVKPLFLIRRHGPLICGICLDATSRPDRYYPRAFFHNLGQPFPHISLNMAAPLLNKKNLMTDFRVDDHLAAATAAETLAARHLWLSQSSLSISELVDHCAAYVDGRFGPVAPFQTAPVELIIYTCVWLGKRDWAQEVLKRSLTEMEQWPERAFNIIKSPGMWAGPLHDLIQVGGEVDLKKIVDSQAKAHGFSALPIHPLLVSEFPDLTKRLC